MAEESLLEWLCEANTFKEHGHFFFLRIFFDLNLKHWTWHGFELDPQIVNGGKQIFYLSVIPSAQTISTDLAV